MKVIEATWEKRNLGVTCVEIEVEKNDPVDEVLNVLKMRQEQYMVVKVASGSADVLFALQKEGFLFIETLFEIVNTSCQKEIQLPPIPKRLNNNVGYHIATEKEISQVIEDVRSGAIFSTDRVALDPFFSQKFAGKRYAYWIEDLIKYPETKMIIEECNGENISFTIYSNKGQDCYSSPLGGLFSQYLDSNLGLISFKAAMTYLRDIKAKKVITHVSSNNIPMLKIQMLFGAQIVNIQYVLIKHSRACECDESFPECSYSNV